MDNLNRRNWTKKNRVRDFENLLKRTTWLEEQYTIGGSQNYPKTRKLIRRRICY